MQTTQPVATVEAPDDLLTLVSVAMLAFIVADIAHEAFGHILGFYLAGGRSALLSTTRLTEWIKLGDPQWRIFDLGGPFGNLTFAFLAWLVQRFVRSRPLPLKLFLWLVMCFNLFWAFGYLVFSGVFARGDWMALLECTRFAWPGRILLVIVGFALYRLSIRFAARELRWFIPAVDSAARSRVSRFILISYISGGVIACAGAVLDPRGRIEILNSGALSSFGAAVGLLSVPGIFLRLPPQSGVLDVSVSSNLPWLIAASAGAIYYIGILGPGILIWLGH